MITYEMEAEMEPRENGKWVLTYDALKQIRELTLEIVQLREKLNRPIPIPEPIFIAMQHYMFGKSRNGLVFDSVTLSYKGKIFVQEDKE